jgi:serine/threonine protein kinase
VTRKGKPINWQSYLNCYEKIKRLGSGGYGTVYLMKHKINQFELSAKFIDISDYYEKADQAELAVKEATLLLKVKHQSIIKLYNAF